MDAEAHRGAPAASPAREELIRRYERVRARTEALAAPLSSEDQQLQSMPSASPTKWHRAHTTWFFETFVLLPRGASEFRKGYGYLYNSYYEAVGPRYSRPARGLVSRPSAAEIGEYRRAIDGRMLELLSSAEGRTSSELASLVELGLAHEEQHQELILTDALHALSMNPLEPAYRSPAFARPKGVESAMRFLPYEGGVIEIGARRDGSSSDSPTSNSFHFDNEGPRHRVFLEPFEMASRLVTVRELLAFHRDGGYETPSLWLSEGLDFVRRERISAPMHARVEGGALVVFGLDGAREAELDEPVSHLSYYEADALAHYLGARLPTEQEWEHVASRNPPDVGNLLDDDPVRTSPLGPTSCTAPPTNGPATSGPAQLFGDVWEWTSSSYAPYPGFQASAGAIGEYNGKFMVSQQVLRGGSCFTPRGHVRASYRNFWHPDTRFQMSGVRLAKSSPTVGTVGTRRNA